MVVSSKKKKSSPSRGLDPLKWLVAVFIVVSCIVGNIYFARYSVSVRAAAIIVGIVVAMALLSTTRHGQVAVKFIKDARMELRKVVWPTRQETLQMTGLVILLVAIMAVLLWAIDSFFAYLITTLIL